MKCKNTRAARPVSLRPLLSVDPDAAALAEIRELYLWASSGDWTDAACRRVDPDLHYPVGRESSEPYQRQTAAAKQVCAVCPVREECLAHAQQNGETDGIWGGLTPAERRQARHNQVQRDALAAALQLAELVTTGVTDTQSSGVA
jgi:WhiB family transcriptional regulator, redox-sensing transcriptional regulator